MLLKQMGSTWEEIKFNKDNLSDEIFLKQREKLLKDIKDIKEIIKTIDNIRSNISGGKIELNDYVINDVKTRKVGIKYEK